MSYVSFTSVFWEIRIYQSTLQNICFVKKSLKSNYLSYNFIQAPLIETLFNAVV